MEKRTRRKAISGKSVAVLVGMWIFIFAYGNLAIAGLVTFQKEYTYQASEADSKLSSRAIALEQVKRLLLEELGTYLESETEVKNFQLTKDQIVILTAGIVRAEIIEERWDGKTYSLKAKIKADPKDVTNSIDKLRQDRQKSKELEQTRQKADQALREVEKLKKELEIARAEKTRFGQYNAAVNRLSATDWFEKGFVLGIAGRYKEAIEAYTRAIELNPKYEEAYNNRGGAYPHLGEYRQAIRDFNKAIELKPDNAGAFYNRGLAYAYLGDNQQAISDYDRAIGLLPKDALPYTLPYHGRGLAYDSLGDHQQAIRDYDRAIELNPEFALAYNNRGVAYVHLREYQQAIRDYDRAIELDPKFAAAYVYRGLAYLWLRNYQQAIKDFNKGIELDPKNAWAYSCRGLAYAFLGDNQQNIRDYKIAARLGSREAQDKLRSQGVSW